jgi:hypothetical protein
MVPFKHIAILILFTLVLVESKIYPDYASFEGCEPTKKCKFDKLQDKYAFYTRSVENTCADVKVDDDFFLCKDSFFLCGYVKIRYPKGSLEPEISPYSGINIASGVDLAYLKEDQLLYMGVPNILVERLNPLLGLKGKAAYDKLKETNFTLTLNEGELLDNISKKNPYDTLEFKFNSEVPSKKFRDLPLDIRTSLFSLYRKNGYQFEDDFWGMIKDNNWDSVYDKLFSRSFHHKESKLESSLIYPYTTYSQFRNSSSFSVFLIDITTIDESKFGNIKKFLAKYFSNHSNSTEAQDHFYSVVLFHQEIYDVVQNKNSNEAGKLIDELNYENYKATNPKRYTNRGLEKGLELIDSGLMSKFNITNKENNFNTRTNIFLFSSGNSDESVEDLSKSIRSRGVNIFSFGVEYKENGEELKKISEIQSNIRISDKINFDNLSCYENSITSYHKFSHMELRPGNFSNVKIYFNNTNYYKLELKPEKNLMLKAILKDDSSEQKNILNIFVSYLDPFPDRRTAEYRHFGRNSDNSTKLINIAGNTSYWYLNKTTMEERKALENLAYIGIWSNSTSESFSFDLELSECDPLSCPSGTNDIDYRPYNLTWIFVILIILSSLFVILFVFYLIRCYRKPVDPVETGMRRTSNYHKLTTP